MQCIPGVEGRPIALPLWRCSIGGKRLDVNPVFFVIFASLLFSLQHTISNRPSASSILVHSLKPCCSSDTCTSAATTPSSPPSSPFHYLIETTDCGPNSQQSHPRPLSNIRSEGTKGNPEAQTNKAPLIEPSFHSQAGARSAILKGRCGQNPLSD